MARYSPYTKRLELSRARHSVAIAFCLASGGDPPPPGPAASWELTVVGTAAATVTAAAIRDAVRAAGHAG